MSAFGQTRRFGRAPEATDRDFRTHIPGMLESQRTVRALTVDGLHCHLLLPKNISPATKGAK